MKPIWRSIVATIAAAVASAITFWAPTGFIAPFLIPESPVALAIADQFLGLANRLVPGLLIGLVAAHRPVLLGAFVSAFVAIAALSYIASTSGQTVSFLSGTLAFFSYFVFGAAGAALGYMLRRVHPNNSFKPKPLRGSA